MTTEGPTTAGSIDARLSLDIDEYERKAKEAKATAKELGKDIRIRVDAETGKAAAELSALETAEKRLATAQEARSLAERRHTLVANDADAVRKKASATEAQVEKAVLAADRAYQQYLKTEDQVTAAEQKVAAAKDAVRKAQDAESESTKKSTDLKKAQYSAIQGIVAASPALVGVLGTAAAAAVGYTAALGAMGGAGVLAVLGIRNEMQAGTAVGARYSAGLAVMKSDLDQLSHTGAVEMLKYFDSSVSILNAHMPYLNRLTGDMSHELGQAGSITLSALLTGLERLDPLTRAGAYSIKDLATWLNHVSRSEGFQEFVTYAVTNLPHVAHDFGELVTLAGRIIAALSPMGPVVLDSIGALAHILNGFPLPVLAGIVVASTSLSTGLTLARAAVAAFGVASGMAASEVTVLGISSNLAVPIIGALLAAVTALAAGIVVASANTKDATLNQANYRAELERTNGAVDEGVRKSVATAVAQSGLKDKAAALGLTYRDLTDYVLKVPGAIDKVNKALDGSLGPMRGTTTGAVGYHRALNDIQKGAVDVGRWVDSNTKSFSDQVQAIKDGNEAAEQSSTALTGQQIKQRDLATALGTTTTALDAAQEAQAKTKQQTDLATAAMQYQNDAAGLLKQALDALNGDALSAAQAQNSLDSQLTNMGTHYNTTGKHIVFTTTSIHDMSAASVALRGQLNGQVQAAENVIVANAKISGTTDNMVSDYQELRKKILDNAEAHGIDRKAVESYIDEIYKIPKDVPKTKLAVDAAEALANLASFQAHLAAIQDRVVHISTVTDGNPVGTGSSIGGRANGSLAGGEATGGLVPQHWATGGTVMAPEYRATGGGFPGSPRGTDTVPTWLTPSEFVVRQPAASAMRGRFPGVLEYINQHGALPQMGGGAPGVATIDPNSIARLEAAIRAIQVAISLDGRVIARAVDRANRDASAGGAVWP
ncbi:MULTISPECIES: hypothetical protein [Arthrobacter]|uniref:Uncharacterized protein n=2 Tax=Arthrobacter TaxID=1663 RepID=A0ABU9KJJ9_9MICC|nr:hypothetical protein [Arthrobacter sp. YJM1]MDP5226627.1 hypothetical protein [Arthrobacter sp. YJM1]